MRKLLVFSFITELWFIIYGWLNKTIFLYPSSKMGCKESLELLDSRISYLSLKLPVRTTILVSLLCFKSKVNCFYSLYSNKTYQVRFMPTSKKWKMHYRYSRYVWLLDFELTGAMLETCCQHVASGETLEVYLTFPNILRNIPGAEKNESLLDQLMKSYETCQLILILMNLNERKFEEIKYLFSVWPVNLKTSILQRWSRIYFTQFL